MFSQRLYDVASIEMVFTFPNDRTNNDNVGKFFGLTPPPKFGHSNVLNFLDVLH